MLIESKVFLINLHPLLDIIFTPIRSVVVKISFSIAIELKPGRLEKL